jgi:hypothetical protein
MIKQQNSYQFLNDLESALSWLYLRAIEDGKNPEKYDQEFKSEFIGLVNRIIENPFLYQSYSDVNPVRRAVLFHGNYIVEYQVIPKDAKKRNDVSEIIFSALLPARSGKYFGAHDKLELFEFDPDDEV